MKVLLLLLIVINQSFANTSSYSDVEKAIQQYQQKIVNLKNNLDKSIFDDEEIILKYDFDAEQLVKFIQEKFAFQPYVGLLRGVQATLNSRAGNALDQSVLLAKLLKDAGFEVRIANGKLTEKDAKLLVASVANGVLPTNIGNGEAFDKALVQFNKSTRKNGKMDWKKTETYKRYRQSKENVEKVLNENNIKLEDVDVTQQLVQQTKDYFWVQYRRGESQQWQDAHPAFKKGVKVAVKALAYIKDTVPKKYLHQLKIEAFIQQRMGGKLIIHSLMKPWIRPVANLNNTSITYTNAPSGVKIGSSFDEIISHSNFFTPTLNGTPVGNKVFDMKGRLIDAEAMNSGPQGALFQTLGNKLEESINRVDGKEKSDTLMQLTAQWLQFTFIEPDGSEFVQKRYLYETNNFKVTQSSNKQAKAALMSEYHFLNSSGQQPMAYLAHTYLKLIDDSIPLLQASAKKVYKPNAKVSISKKDLDIKSSFELLVQYNMMETQPDENKAIIKYKASANLMGIKRGFIDAENAFITVDIISNKKRYLVKKGKQVFLSAQSAFTSGVWETASEWLPSRFLNLPQESLDTLQIQSAANKQNIEMRVLKSDQLKDLNVKNESILAKIKQEMKQGYMIIIPEKKPNNIAMTGWWRINLTTGETLGMTADGGGQSATEYIIENIQMSISFIRAVNNLKKCQKLTNDVAKLCCLTEAHFNNVAGMAFGNALGASLGTAASVVFDVVDIATEAATGTGIAPSTNGALCKKVPHTPNL
jgi:ribosomal protein S21